MAGERTPEQIQAELAEVEGAIAAQQLAGEGGGEGEATPNAAATTNAVEAAAEAEASRKGWVPKAQYKGDPAKWKPASQYLEDGQRYNKNLQRELAELRAEVAEQKRIGTAFAKFHEESMARKDQELAEAIAQTKRQVREATRNGNDDLADSLETRVELLQTERAGLKTQKPEDVPEDQRARALNADGTANTNNPLVEAWIEDGNEWFRDNPKLRAYAVQLGQELMQGGETVRGRKFLDKVAEKMAEEFPRQFAKKETAVRNAGQVETADGAGSSGTSYSIRDLPPEDLSLMKDLISQGHTTKEKFLASYFSGAKKVHRSS